MTRQVRAFLDRAADQPDAQGLQSLIEDLKENDYPDYLARHLIRQIKSALRGLPAQDRKRRQSELTNALLGFIHDRDDTVTSPTWFCYAGTITRWLINSLQLPA